MSGYPDHPEDDARRRADYEKTHRPVFEWDRPWEQFGSTTVYKQGEIRVITSRKITTGDVGACHVATDAEVRRIACIENGVKYPLEEIQQAMALITDTHGQLVNDVFTPWWNFRARKARTTTLINCVNELARLGDILRRPL